MAKKTIKQTKTARTAKTGSAAKTSRAAEAFSPVETVKQAFSNFTGKLEMPGSARDFVTRAAVTASERAAEAHKFADTATGKAEMAFTTIVGGSAKITRNLLQVSFENLEATLTVVQQVAAAKSLSEALQIQADFARDYTKANYNRIREAAETIKETVQDGAKTVQAEMSKYNPFMKQAA